MIDWGKINNLLSSSVDMEEVKSNLKEIGIDILNDDGNMKRFTDVLEELSNKWDELSNNED